MPLDGGLEIAVRQLSGTPLVALTQALLPQRAVNAIRAIRPILSEQPAVTAVLLFFVQIFSVWANIDVDFLVISKHIPFELHLYAVMGRLRPEMSC